MVAFIEMADVSEVFVLSLFSKSLNFVDDGKFGYCCVSNWNEVLIV